MSKIFVSQPENKREIKLTNHVTPWLTFKERHQLKAFESFQTSQSSFNVFIGLYSVLTAYSLFSGWASYEYFPSHFSFALFLFSLLTPTLVGICIIAIHLYQRKTLNNSPKSEQLESLTRNLQSLWLFGTCVVFCLNIVLIGKNGLCDPDVDDFEKTQACNIGSADQMPEDMMMISAIMPGLFAMMVKGAKWEYVIVTFLSNIFAVLFTMFYYDLTSSLPSFLIFLPVCSIVMYENQRQSISLFLLTQSQKNLLEENERLAAETHANELRHMIGNVAHDLKTPLSAFVNGVDIVLGIMTEIELLHQTVADKLPLQAKRAVATMKEAVVNMKNTNEFMIMTINRCIDYTKASQGLKLVPRLETIRFIEAINLPLNCMKGLQDNRIGIKLLPVSNFIASHIITDKQWLQENILCLLSNAVKYSAGGEVSVSAVLYVDGNIVTHTEDNIIESLSQKRPDSTKNTCIRIEVEDTGIGIAEEMRMNLFSPFKQAQRLAGGTGLGLYSLAKRIETLGGTYGVSSRKDGAQGSLFWFTVPYRPDEQISVSISAKNRNIGMVPVRSSLLLETADQSLADVSPGHLQRVKSLSSENVELVDSSRKGLNILVVDDSVSILKMSSMMLRRQGHTVTTADNGAVALRILTEQMTQNNNNTSDCNNSSTVLFDVVLMDLQMPIMDGLEATSRLRKFEKSFNNQENSSTGTEVNGTIHKYSDASQQIARHQLILGVSANSDNETMEAAFTAGIDAFIPKPFNMQCFNEVYSNVLAKQVSVDQ